VWKDSAVQWHDAMVEAVGGRRQQEAVSELSE
jgi:hypothetical protein